VGIAESVAAAGLTHGVFYTHFESKESLCTQVIGLASGRSRAALDSSAARNRLLEMPRK
jgi:AcrR family transcriptional regulator